MSRILGLPMELFDEIFSYINTEDLKSLACVDCSFYNFATRKIWDHTHDDRQKQRQIFMWACGSGSTSALLKLLKAGLTTNCNYQAGHSQPLGLPPKWYLIIPQSDFGQFQAFLPYMDTFHWQSTPRRRHGSFWTPLHVAVMHGQSQIVDILLEHGACIDAPSRNYCSDERWDLIPEGKYTPLHVALQEGKEDIANSLISNGASIYVDHEVHRPERTWGSERGRLTAFHCCAMYNRVDTADFLMKRGHETAINEIDEFGFSPLMYAYYYRKLDAFRFLLTQGASPRVTTTTWRSDVPQGAFKSEFSSILHQACLNGSWEYVWTLIEHGSDVNELDRNEEQPLLHLMRYIDRELRSEHSSNMDKARERLYGFNDLFKSVDMRSQANTKTLTGSLKVVLEWVLMPLVSYLLDESGLDMSTMLHVESTPLEKMSVSGFWEPSLLFREWGDESTSPHTSKAFKVFDDRPYYSDIGRHATQQTLLEYACFHADMIPDMLKMVELLLAKGCLRPGDFGCYARALKNLAHRPVYGGSQGRILDECAQMICSYFWVTLHGESEKPTIPIDLLDNHLLRHEHTFEGLCRAFLMTEGKEGGAAVMDYIDRGGRYSFTFSSGATALYHACYSGNVQLVGRLLDLGADPDRCLTPGNEYGGVYNNGLYEEQLREDEEAMWQLLIVGGANPFQWNEKNPGNRFPWKFSLDHEGTARSPFFVDIFGRMCMLASEDSSDDGDLTEVLDLACPRGRYTDIQKMRTRAKIRVDAIIRKKATIYLHELLDNLSPQSDIVACNSDFRTIKQMDEAIDTLGLILELGPSGILTSSWQEREGEDDFTALEFISNFLTDTWSPHDLYTTPYEECSHEDQRHWKIHWCLTQRLEMGSDSAGKPTITILSRRIEWPSEWPIPDSYLTSSMKDQGVEGFGWMRSPWGCNCWFTPDANF
ncbi:hypothetical protein PG993_004292 [Apiospora rasikravindrae]|uniref:F-box domain-containing protein n=1 Tax=Apiospora rasikravindrae TaxID=990691 RepID=A0ABR1TF25_9PEZI